MKGQHLMHWYQNYGFRHQNSPFEAIIEDLEEVPTDVLLCVYTLPL